MSLRTHYIRIRRKSDDAKLTGLTVQLLPVGGTYPGDAITLTQDSGTNWQYNFTSGVTNGWYYLYVSGSQVLSGGTPVQIRVIRDLVSADDCDFVDDWDL